MTEKTQKFPGAWKISSFLVLLLISGVPAWLFAEENMDSLDSFTSARNSAFARVQNGYFQDALLAEDSAFQKAKNKFGINHPSVVPILNDLATLDRYLALYPQAESNLKWALAIRERGLAPRDPLIAESLDLLASLYMDLGRWTEAEFYAQRALEIAEKGGDTGNIQLSGILNNLGTIELNTGKTGPAQGLFKRSLGILEKNRPALPAAVIQAWTLLASAFLADGHFADAESCLQTGRKIGEKNFPADSVEVGDCLQRLGDFYQTRNQPEKAKPLWGASLALYKRFVGTFYGYSALPYMKRLARAYQSMGDAKSARDLLENSLKTTREVFGTRNPRTALVLLDLARLEKRLGSEKSEREHLREALEILRSLFKPDYPLIREAEALP